VARVRNRLVPITGRLAELSPTRLGALLYILSGMVFVASDSLTKALVSDLPVLHVVFGRNLGYTLAVLLVAGRRHPGRLFVTRRPGTQIARGLTMLAGTGSFFLALSLLPFAEVQTLGSTTPLFVVALAGPLLGERVTGSAVAGAVVGFGGVVALVGLDAAHLDPAVLVPLGTAFAIAVLILLTRSLKLEDPNVTIFWSGLVGLAGASALELVVPTARMPTPLEWAGIGVVSLASLAGHSLLVLAYRHGRASDLAPLGYLSLVWSFALGALVFGEGVEVKAVAGAVLIAAGGILAVRGAPDEASDVTVDAAVERGSEGGGEAIRDEGPAEPVAHSQG
jgi:drug/metabolite transporter (DMT)-like permease